ncbi:MAG: S41 family peptidase [Acidobacteria bacterium]|nr:S41 family peptidase [Acidobacteriota bacterium]
MLRLLVFLLTALCGVGPVWAQLTPDQRLLDFQTLAGLYAKRYAPASWKSTALAVNIFDLKPWLDRVRSAPTDLDFYQICAEYVAQFQDGHSSFRTPSNLVADLGLFTDIYDGKLLIEQINRTRYPANLFPFAVGDELVSMDGQPVEAILADLVRQKGFGTLRGARRMAADALPYRQQMFYAKTADLPDETEVEIRRAQTGVLEKYRLTWLKTGSPIRTIPPVPDPLLALNAEDGPGSSAPYLGLLNDLRNWSLDPLLLGGQQRTVTDESGEQVSREYVLGWGIRAPYYNLPADFVIRRGNSGGDNFYTGTFTADGQRIGFIRIPHFSPQLAQFAVRELEAEIAFMKANTDGLIVDVTRNTGGTCVGLDYAQRLIPREVYAFSELFRPTQSTINSFESSLRLARLLRAEPWVITTYETLLQAVTEAAAANRGMTAPLPSCAPAFSPTFIAPRLTYPPLLGDDGQPVAYDKPLIVLADELSVSFGDIFPAMMQDNRRGPIVGIRTGGLGGSISTWQVGVYSEATASTTNTLVVRRGDVKAPDLPAAPYIENIGVLPDIDLDYMTRENLMTRGRPFMGKVTQIMLEEIRKPRVQ